MATDIHLPVETSPVSKTATYLTIWTIGAHDLYKFDPNGTIQILKQKPPQKFENINITEDIRLQDLKKSTNQQLELVHLIQCICYSQVGMERSQYLYHKTL